MITMKDTCRLAQTVSDGYGDKSVEVLTEVACLFLQSTGNSHSNNAEVISSDAHVYLDIQNPVIVNLGYKIEGMYLIVAPFGNLDNKDWYRITRVVVGQRKLLANDVDNVHAYLRKVVPLEVSYVS